MQRRTAPALKHFSSLHDADTVRRWLNEAAKRVSACITEMHRGSRDRRLLSPTSSSASSERKACPSKRLRARRRANRATLRLSESVFG